MVGWGYHQQYCYHVGSSMVCEVWSCRVVECYVLAGDPEEDGNTIKVTAYVADSYAFDPPLPAGKRVIGEDPRTIDYLLNAALERSLEVSQRGL
ncbi:MAG: hypothetical protein DRN06_06700 [Thermoprotei archaeon]|nr:MAG: hypothetical protein DRN06_06700 [Thermoprotei archaeon]